MEQWRGQDVTRGQHILWRVLEQGSLVSSWTGSMKAKIKSHSLDFQPAQLGSDARGSWGIWVEDGKDSNPSQVIKFLWKHSQEQN